MCTLMVLEAFVFCLALSMDTFAASFAYGSSKIQIPNRSIWVISLICSVILVLSYFMGVVVKPFFPKWLAHMLCFGILFFHGMVKLLDGVIKAMIRKYNAIQKQIDFELFHLQFVLQVYANPEAADRDQSKTISPKEAACLAIALSLDGLAAGFGAGLGRTNGFLIFACSLFTNALAVVSGLTAGNKLSDRVPFELSWAGGVILIILAILKLS